MGGAALPCGLCGLHWFCFDWAAGLWLARFRSLLLRGLGFVHGRCLGPSRGLHHTFILLHHILPRAAGLCLHGLHGHYCVPLMPAECLKSRLRSCAASGAVQGMHLARWSSRGGVRCICPYKGLSGITKPCYDVHFPGGTLVQSVAVTSWTVRCHAAAREPAC